MKPHESHWKLKHARVHKSAWKLNLVCKTADDSLRDLTKAHEKC